MKPNNIPILIFSAIQMALLHLTPAFAAGQASVITYEYDAVGRMTLITVSVPTSLDSDGDGIPDYIKNLAGTNPYLIDSDGDGIQDGMEDSQGMGSSLLLAFEEATGSNLNGLLPKRSLN